MTEIRTQAIERTLYAEFLDSVAHTAFQRLDWLEQVERLYPVQLHTLGHFQNGSLFAVTPLLQRRMGPFVLWGSPLRQVPIPPTTVFCAPESAWQLAWQGLHDWCVRERLSYMQASFPRQAWSQWRDDPRTEIVANIEVDLDRPLAELWKGLSQLPKRCVRGAVRKGVKVHWKYDANILDEQIDLLRGTYDRQGIEPNFPLPFYHAIFNDRKNNGLRILCASYRGQCVAVIWVMLDKNTCYYWDAAAREEGRDLNANHLLVWGLIRWAKKRGLKKLDFVGAGGRAGSKPGIKRFKLSMGGEEVTQPMVFLMSPLLRFALAAYRIVSLFKIRLSGWIKSVRNCTRPDEK